MDVTSGTSLELRFTFTVNKDYVSPTSATYTLYGRSGTVVAGMSDVVISLSPGANSAGITIPYFYNELDGTNRIETRQVRVTYIVDNVRYYIEKKYRIIPQMNVHVEGHDVLNELGLFEEDYDPNSISLVNAYLHVENVLGQTQLETYLSQGSLNTLRANDAIKIRAAIDLIPSLMMRVGARHVTDNVQFHRFEGPDWELLKKRLLVQYEKALQPLLEQTGSTTERAYILTTERADPVTGE